MITKEAAILNAALELFVEFGFYGVSTSMISKKAGVATGTLFNYFPTKEELINSLYLDCRKYLTNSISKGLENVETVEGKLTLFLINGIHFKKNHQNEFLFIQQFANSPQLKKITLNQGTQQLEFLYDIIEEGKRQKLFKNTSTELLVQALFGVAGALDWYIINQMNEVTDDLIDEAVNIMLDTIRI